MIIQDDNIVIESVDDLKSLNAKLNHDKNTKFSVVEDVLWFDYGVTATIANKQVENELKLNNLL